MDASCRCNESENDEENQEDTRKKETATALSKGKRREVPRAQLAYLELKHVHPGLLAGIGVQAPPTHTGKSRSATLHAAPRKYKPGQMRRWVEGDNNQKAQILRIWWLLQEHRRTGKAASSVVAYMRNLVHANVGLACGGGYPAPHSMTAVSTWVYFYYRCLLELWVF